ncbi:MAG: putative phage tail protein [Candidatus Frackibacter sp. T328-2]|nr:MAG: putative phage tail protein [Candidatus Frackibacter sp. T328-2]
MAEAIITAAVNWAVSQAVSYVATELFGSGPGQPDKEYFHNKNNTKSQELPIPVVYGRNMLGGNIIYEKITGDNNRYKDMQIGVSEGPIQSISNIKIGEVSFSNFDNSQARTKLGNRAQTADAVNDQGQTFPYLAYISAELDGKELEDSLDGRRIITALIEGRKVEVWDSGSSSWITQYSRNPAYCLLDLLTNKRYGLGIDKQYIDLDSFIESANYCNELIDDGQGGQEPRFQLDIAINQAKSSLDLIKEILGTFRGILIYSSGELRLKIDAPEAPTQSFAMNNIVKDSFAYWEASKKDIPNKVTVQYIDPNNNWEKIRVQYVDDSNIESSGEVREKKISLLGIKRFSQAGREARFYLNKAKYCTTFCEFKAGIDSIHCEVGDVITVTHDLPEWTDKEFRILKIKEDKNDEMKLICQEHNDAVYNDEGIVQQPKKDSTLPNPFAKPDTVLNLTAIESGELIGDGSYVPAIHVTYDKPADHYWKYAHTYYKVSSAVEWTYAGRTEELEFDIKPVSPEIYDVKVVSENRHGIKADFGTSPTTTITITGNENPPSDVTWATCTFEDQIVLQWNDIPDQDKSGFEIRTADMDWGQDTTANSELIYRGNALSHIKEPETVSETFYIKAFNRSGVYSANAASVTITNAVPPQPTLHVNSTLSQLQLAVDDPNIKDLDIIEFQIDTDSNFGSPEIYKGKDFIREVPAIGDTTNYVRARFIDKLGQQGPWGSGSITPNLIDAKDINQSFNINPISDVTPSSGSLEQLWDMDTGLGPAFGSAPTITFEYPMQWFFDMVRFYPSVACNYYVQAWDKDTEAWIDVIGSSASPVACNANQWNIKRFDNDKMVATSKMRIVFDAALTLYELKFWTVTLSDEILAQVLTLTGNMKVQSENSSTYIDANGITVSGSPAENEAGAQAKANNAESNANDYTDTETPDNPNNMVLKPTFEDGQLGKWTAGNIVSVTGQSFTKAIEVSQRDAYEDNWFPVKEGEKYFVSADINTTNANYETRFGLHFEKADGSNNWQPLADLSTGNDWTHVTATITVPDGFIKARPFLQMNGHDAPFGTAQATNFSITRFQAGADITGDNHAKDQHNFDALQGQAAGGRVKLTNQGVWGYNSAGNKRAGFDTTGKWIAGGGAVEADENGIRSSNGAFSIDTAGNAYFEGKLGTMIEVDGQTGKSQWKINKFIGTKINEFSTGEPGSVTVVTSDGTYLYVVIPHQPSSNGELIKYNMNGVELSRVTLPKQFTSDDMADEYFGDAVIVNGEVHVLTSGFYYNSTSPDDQWIEKVRFDLNGNRLGRFTCESKGDDTYGYSAGGITYDGTSFWYAYYDAENNTNYLKELGSSTSYTVSGFTSGLAYDGKYIWGHDQDNGKLEKMNISGVVVKVLSSTATNPGGLGWIDDFLYLTDTNDNTIHVVTGYDLAYFVGLMGY